MIGFVCRCGCDRITYLTDKSNHDFQLSIFNRPIYIILSAIPLF